VFLRNFLSLTGRHKYRSKERAKILPIRKTQRRRQTDNEAQQKNRN
jgi:hypothetical protein